MRNKIIAVVLMLSLALTACVPKAVLQMDSTPTATLAVTPEPTATPQPTLDRDVAIVYTNDIHCGNKDAIEYAYLAAFVDEMESDGNHVLLVDAGDAVQGGPIGTVSKGGYIIEIMNKLGYDVATIGNHEFDYGMDRFFELAKQADFPYISCNFRNIAKEIPVFDSYKIFDFSGVKIAFVGICTPKTITSSTPMYFQNDAGEFIYDFCQDKDGSFLYETVQASVDAARAEGAQYVIALGHLGIDYSTSPWMSTEVIANTQGIDAFIDGHSHTVMECERVKNQSGEYVLLTQTGTKLAHAGMLLITKDGNISTGLVNVPAEPDAEIKSFIEEMQAQYAEQMQQVVAHSDFELTVNQPETDPPVRIVRNAETNLGDLCADAYRTIGGADVGFINGGGVRVSIAAGDITYQDIINVFPFGNNLCVVEATGAEILQALEMGVRVVPEESGGFLQTSGLTYEVHTYIKSPVVLTEDGLFDRLDGENRVKNVLVGGEPLNLGKKYTVACHDYMLHNGGDGFTMFMDNVFVKEMVMLDNQMLITYMTENLEGTISPEYADPFGQGRIVAVEQKPTV